MGPEQTNGQKEKMIKKIKVEQLKSGMFVHDFNCSWLDHPFLTNSIKINDEQVVQKIIDSNRTGPQTSISQQMESESWDAKVEELSRIVMALEAVGGERIIWNGPPP